MGPLCEQINDALRPFEMQGACLVLEDIIICLPVAVELEVSQKVRVARHILMRYIWENFNRTRKVRPIVTI
jgi:hypothetical protein